MRIYRDLATWYPLMTPAGDYADEADHLLRLIDAVCEGPSETLLELGAGPVTWPPTSRGDCDAR